jgi:signal transduction histidine kinase
MLFAGAVIAAVFALVAESVGTTRHPTIDLVAGCALLATGFVVLALGSSVAPGALLIASGVAWFLATAGADDVVFLHRALLVHALVLAAAGARAVGPWVVIGVAYLASVDRELAVATPWTMAVALGVVTVVVAATAMRRWPRLAALVALAGTVTWAGAASFVRTSGWFDARDRLLLYATGLAGVAASIAIWASWKRRAMTVSSGDLVRDDGRGSVRVAFRGENGEFEDIAGAPFVAGPGEVTTVVDLGPDHGEVLLAHGHTELNSSWLGTAALDVQTIDSLRLVAQNQRAVQTLRTHAAEVAASAERIRIADGLAAAQLSSEMERIVVPRIQRAISELGDDGSTFGAEARASLALVVGEVQGLAAGLAPTSLRNGLSTALADLAGGDAVSVRCDVDDATIDAASALVIYFVVAECVTNALRHGAPSFVDVDVHARDSGDVELTVQDDGPGIATDQLGGGGLTGLRSRVEASGGTVVVCARQGGGTVVTVRLPNRVAPHVAITRL